MTTTSNRFFDEMAKLMSNAAGAAQGLRREVDTLVQAQVERVLNSLEIVKREEFEAVKEMAARAREENDSLRARIERLEPPPAAPAPASSVIADTPETPTPTISDFPAPNAPVEELPFSDKDA